MKKLLLRLGSFTLLLAAVLFLSRCSDNTTNLQTTPEVVPKDTVPLGVIFTPASMMPTDMAPDPGCGGTLPSVFALDMPPVMNQGGKWSCVACAVGYAARSYQRFVSYYNQSGFINYSTICSPEYLWGQIRTGGCTESKGSYFVTNSLGKGALDLLVSQGVCSWQDMPGMVLFSRTVAKRQF